MKYQFGENDVRKHLTPYHDRIVRTIHSGYSQWLAVKRFMATNDHSSVLYPRTIQNFVFDAVIRHALAEFADDPEIRIIQESQTVKFCFGDIVLARFKKGDEDNLGQNHPTSAVLNFVSAEKTLPGLPPAATKVEFLYSANDIEDGIERVVVAARDGENLLWHYEIDESAESGQVVPFPSSVPSQDNDSADEPIVVPRKRDDESDTEGR